VVEAFRHLLASQAANFTRRGYPPGYMISTAVLAAAVENVDIAAHMSALRHANVARFSQRLEQGIAGQMRTDTEITALVRFIGAVIQGMAPIPPPSTTSRQWRSPKSSARAFDKSSGCEEQPVAPLADAQVCNDRERPILVMLIEAGDGQRMSRPGSATTPMVSMALAVKLSSMMSSMGMTFTSLKSGLV
jgi:hypothetical protein